MPRHPAIGSVHAAVHAAVFAAVLAAGAAGTAGGLTAQTLTDSSASGSATYFSESKTTNPFDAASSGTYAVVATVGEHEPGRASSVTYAVTGGFTATLGTITGGPVLAAASPRFVNPLGSDLVWLNGSRLDIGGAPQVTVSGRAAAIVAKSGTHVAIRLPALSDPGWHRIELATTTGTTSLERGIGVMPMLFTEGAAASNEPFDLVFKGTQNDTVVWSLGFSAVPPIRLPPYLHGLTVNPLPLIRILDTFLITDPSGEFREPIPPVPFRFPIHSQALVITSNPGYAPGSFTNRMVFE